MLCPIGHNKLRLCLRRGVIKTVVSWEFRRVSWEFRRASCDITAEKKSPFFLVTPPPVFW